MIFCRKYLASRTTSVLNMFNKRSTSLCQSKMNIKTTAEVKSEAKRIVWVDLEMTGLDIDKDHILEIACLVTDANLEIVATGPNIIIHQPDEILHNMHQWCITQHALSKIFEKIMLNQLLLHFNSNELLHSEQYVFTKGRSTADAGVMLLKYIYSMRGRNHRMLLTGLTDKSRESKISVKEAENQILTFVKAHAPENKCPLAGNSVYMDRLFLRKYMPNLNNYLNYRIIDVSTIKELAKRWYPKEYSRSPQKKFQHRCLSDVIESIEEMKYYKQHIFKTV